MRVSEDFDLGFERAGLTCKWQVEIDDYANKVLAKHWPNVRRHRDIRDFPPEPHSEWRVDVICGGFPCQDISSAGLRAGITGARSGLFWSMAASIRLVRPQYVVLENVAALLDRGMGDVLGEMAESGYDTEWDCLPAANFGAPYKRDRIFIVAYPDSKHGGAGRQRGLVGVASGVCLPGLPRQQADAPETGVGHWAVEPRLGRLVRGFPPAVDRLRGLGNAVVPQVAQWLGERIIESAEELQ